jgi:hypothetical protein
MVFISLMDVLELENLDGRKILTVFGWRVLREL